MPQPIRTLRSRAARFVRAAGAATAANRLAAPASSRAPASAAGARDPRLVVIILRGALDGLSAVAADRRSGLRRRCTAISPSPPPAIGPRCRSTDIFVAHPALGAFKRLYDKRQAAVVHAVATGYRDRSHFDGQDVLESGYPGPGRTESGWLNRALSALPASAQARQRGLGVGATRRLSSAGRRPRWAGRRRAASRRRAAISHSVCSTSTPTRSRARRAARRRRSTAEKVAAEAPGTAAAKKPHPGGRGRTMRVAAAGAARAASPRPMGRGSPRSPSTASTPISERGRGAGLSRPAPAGARRRLRRLRDESRRRLEGHSRGRDHRIRPYRAGQRHPRHRPWHRQRSRCWRAARWPAAGSSPTGRA